MRSKHALVVAAAIAIAGAQTVGAGTAAADRLTCPLAEAGAIDVDGMLDDWSGVEPLRAGAGDDARFELRCQYDGQRLQLSIDVRDDLLVRNAAARGRLQAGEDQLEIAIGQAAPLSITLFPGYMRSPPRRAVGGGAAPRWLGVEDTLQRRGWSAELDLPLAKVAGWTAAAPSVPVRVAYRDSDRFAGARTETLVEAEVELELGDKKDLLRGFLAATRLSRADLRVDLLADVDRARPGRERVVAGGAVIGVLADQFGFVQLPVQAGADVKSVEAVDLRGDGSRVILAQVRQRARTGESAADGGLAGHRTQRAAGAAGSRDLLLGFTARAGQLAPLFTIEVGKQQGGRSLASRWRIDAAAGPRAGGRKRPALVVEAQAAIGWDEDSYDEAPAPDAEPIHVPWDDDRRGGVYWLEGDALRSRAIQRR